MGTASSPAATPTPTLPAAAPATSTASATSTPTGPRLPRLHATPATPHPIGDLDPPRRLSLTAVGLDVPVASIGLGVGGQLALPPNPADVGWYSYGPAPGAAAGSVLLAGHLDSYRYGLGPLIRLRAVETGDLIDVTSTAGRDVRYRVTDVQRVPKAELASLGVFDRTGAPTLRIVTCAGSFSAATGYSDNLVVTAKPTT